MQILEYKRGYYIPFLHFVKGWAILVNGKGG